MKGRRRDASSTTPPLPELWSPHDLDQRPGDGPATFALTRIERPSRRGSFPMVVLVLGAVGLVGFGLLGREGAITPTPAGTGAGATLAASDAPSPFATAPAAAAQPRPGKGFLFLTSPSHDDAVVDERLAVVGYVRGSQRDLAIALLDGQVAVRTWAVVAATKAGDPAWQVRSWFETETATADLPTGRAFRLVVDLLGPDGATLDTVERTIRVGPIIEPGESDVARVRMPVFLPQPTLGEDGLVGDLIGVQDTGG